MKAPSYHNCFGYRKERRSQSQHLSSRFREIGACKLGNAEAVALGVREVADYRAFDTAAWRRRFDLVFDTAGALSVGECSSMLKSGGGAVQVVFAPRKVIACLFSPRHKLASGNPTSQRMAGITKAAEQGKLVPKIGRIVTLSEAIPGLSELETAGTPRENW